MSTIHQYITWDPDRTDGHHWVVFQPEHADEQPPDDGVSPTGQVLGEYESYVAARRAHPDARITTSAAEAIKYGNI